MRHWLAISYLVALLAMASQVGIPMGSVGPFGGGVAATPGFVNDTSWNSNFNSGTTYAVATRVASTITCANFTKCIPLGDGTLTGNLEILAGSSSGSAAPSALDVNATGTTVNSSYSCAVGSASTGSTFPWLCYKLNTASGGLMGQVTLGSSGTFTSALARSEQWYNIASTSALDGSIGSCAGTTTTTPGCASVTTTQSNDLIYAIICPVSNQVTTFTAGTGYTVRPTDQQAACDVETKIDASAGSITPSATFGSTSTYVEIVAAFKSATQGTAPTGVYLANMMSYNTPPGSTTPGSVTVKFPSQATGDFLVETNSCNTVTVSSITDGTNTWTTDSNFAGSGNNSNESYVINSTANATGSITIVTSGTGDCTFKFYDFVGAPTSLSTARSNWNDTTGSSGAFLSQVAYLSAISTNNWFLATPTSGISVFSGGQGLNTSIAVNGPSQFLLDACTDGGENISGPWPCDQNNWFAHAELSSAVTSLLSFKQTNSNGANWGGGSGTIFSVYPSTATVPIASYISTPITTGTDNRLTGISIPSGSMIMVAVNAYHSTSPARTTSSVCYNATGTGCTGGTALTECTSCVTVGTTLIGATSIWYSTAVSATVTQLDATFNNSVTDAEFRVIAFNAPATWSLDASNSGGSASGTTITGPSITTTGVVDACTAIEVPQSGTVGLPTAEKYVYGGYFYSPQGTAFVDGLFTSTGSYAPSWTDSASGDSFHASALCLKHS